MKLPDTVETATIRPGPLQFSEAKTMADALASDRIDDPVCLSWFDRARDRESPAHVSECHGDCEFPGSVEYAISRGATLIVAVGDNDYLFCYRPLGEFA